VADNQTNRLWCDALMLAVNSTKQLRTSRRGSGTCLPPSAKQLFVSCLLHYSVQCSARHGLLHVACHNLCCMMWGVLQASAGARSRLKELSQQLEQQRDMFTHRWACVEGGLVTWYSSRADRSVYASAREACNKQAAREACNKQAAVAFPVPQCRAWWW
jgi:hypothetical protein